LSALRAVETIAQLAGRSKIHPIQILVWKKALIEGAPEVFGSGGSKADREQETMAAHLYKQIGQLRIARS